MNPWKLTRGQRLLVNTKAGDTVLGVVRDVTRHCIWLGDAQFVAKDGSRLPLDGEAIVPADSVDWLQVH